MSTTQTMQERQAALSTPQNQQPGYPMQPDAPNQNQPNRIAVRANGGTREKLDFTNIN